MWRALFLVFSFCSRGPKAKPPACLVLTFDGFVVCSILCNKSFFFAKQICFSVFPSTTKNNKFKHCFIVCCCFLSKLKNLKNEKHKIAKS